MTRILFSLLVVLVMSNNSFSQDKQYKIRTVAFYNLENLFDTINNPAKNDEASPMMELKGNKSKVYWDKIDKLGSVLADIGLEKTKNSPVLIGVCEIENDTVLKDLVNGKNLKDKRYSFAHHESPDKRGIDVALLYQPRYFKPVSQEGFSLMIYDTEGERVYTRDQLLVSGYLDDELIHIIVNHWPSKRGGSRSIAFREKAAALNLEIIEKIREKEPNAKVITMGDFNDDPIESSFKKIMKTKSKKDDVAENDMYNPYESKFKKGSFTGAYRDNISLFDQVIVSSQFVTATNDFSDYKMYDAKIYSPKRLINRKGRFKGYPRRSFSYGKYVEGYSDHFPVYIFLMKEKK